jgi:hypothetical protein
MLLLVIGIFFIGPLIVAWVLHAQGWTPGAQVNYGTLVSPAVPLPPFSVSRLDGHEAEPAAQAWLVVVVSRDAQCAETCVRALEGTRRVRDLLGRDRDRVQRVLVAAQPVAPAPLAMHADVVALDASGGEGQGLRDIFAKDPDGAVYIADPARNLIVRYEPGEEPKHLLDDLKRLLKYAGR